MFSKNSFTYTVSGLKEGYGEIKSKMYTKVTKLQFYSSMKAHKVGKIHENPLHENFLIHLSLDENALKNSVILELYDF
jgi:hypothetical protein